MDDEGFLYIKDRRECHDFFVLHEDTSFCLVKDLIIRGGENIV